MRGLPVLGTGAALRGACLCLCVQPLRSQNVGGGSTRALSQSLPRIVGGGGGRDGAIFELIS